MIWDHQVNEYSYLKFLLWICQKTLYSYIVLGYNDHVTCFNQIFLGYNDHDICFNQISFWQENQSITGPLSQIL
jgi:hypothetical protein